MRRCFHCSFCFFRWHRRCFLFRLYDVNAFWRSPLLLIWSCPCSTLRFIKLVWKRVSGNPLLKKQTLISRLGSGRVMVGGCDHLVWCVTSKSWSVATFVGKSLLYTSILFWLSSLGPDRGVYAMSRLHLLLLLNKSVTASW